MESIRNLVDNIWSDLEMDRLLPRSRALNFWKPAVGEKLAPFCSVINFSESTLFIKAFNAAVAMELRYRSSEILAVLNESSGEELFLSLKIVVKSPRDRER